MHQLVESLSIYADAPFFMVISNGLVHLSDSFFFGCGRWRLVVSSQTLSPTLYSTTGFLFFVILCFHLVSSLFEGSFGFGMDFLHFRYKGGQGQCSERGL